MAYQGISPYIYQQNNLTNVQLIDDISSQFNGSTTTFTMTSGGDTFHAVASRAIFIVLGGIVQEPDVDYTTAGDQITFTTAPVSGLSFAGRKIYGLNKLEGINDGLVTPSKLSLGGPSWDNSGNTTISGYASIGSYATVAGNITQTGDTNNIFINTDTPTVRPTLDLNFERDQRLDSRITFSRDSIATYLGSDGLIKTAQPNIPRFEFDTDRNCLGLLIEESRTNLLTYSDLTSGASGSWWANGGPTVSQGSNVTAPDGTLTAWNTVYNGASGDGNLYRGGGEVTTTNSTSYTISVWAKVPSTNTYITGVKIRTFNDDHSGTFNLLTGTSVGTAEGTTTNRIEAYPNDWYRCSITFTSGTDGNQGIQFYLINNSSTSLNSSGANGEELYLWGAQMEAGSFATSYIPTTTATVTRSADNASITGTNFTDFYNQTEGSIFCDYNIPFDNSGTVLWVLTQSVYTNSDRIVNNINSLSTLYSSSGGTNYVNLSLNSGIELQNSSAISWKTDDVSIYLSSGDSDSVSSYNLPINLGRLDIGHRSVVGGDQQHVNGHIKRLTYYPKRLPNAQLQNLTK